MTITNINSELKYRATHKRPLILEITSKWKILFVMHLGTQDSGLIFFKRIDSEAENDDTDEILNTDDKIKKEVMFIAFYKNHNNTSRRQLNI